MKHLISIDDLSVDDIHLIMDEAERFREALEGREIKKPDAAWTYHFYALLRELNAYPLLVRDRREVDER